MKKFITICVLLLAVFGVVVLGLVSNKNENNEILRIHIRANSNTNIDQTVKYQVKDAVVSVLLPILTECESKEDVEQ